LVGALKDSGIDEPDAHVYAEGVRRGGTLVTAKVADDRVSAAEEVLQRNRAVDVATRDAAYRAGGWSSFDESAPALTADEVAREREAHSTTPTRV
jgi:hypothetical protein